MRLYSKLRLSAGEGRERMRERERRGGGGLKCIPPRARRCAGGLEPKWRPPPLRPAFPHACLWSTMAQFDADTGGKALQRWQHCSRDITLIEDSGGVGCGGGAGADLQACGGPSLCKTEGHRRQEKFLRSTAACLFGGDNAASLGAGSDRGVRTHPQRTQRWRWCSDAPPWRTSGPAWARRLGASRCRKRKGTSGPAPGTGPGRTK